MNPSKARRLRRRGPLCDHRDHHCPKTCGYLLTPTSLPIRSYMRKASLLTIFLIVFIDLMGFGIVLPNLQLYGLRFGISSYFALTLLGASYSLCQFLFAPVLGKWSDHIGRRPVLIVSQAGTLLGFLILYAAHWYE